MNSIWEGSGNIMCLDVLRVLAKQQGISELLHDAFGAVKGQDRHFDRAWRQLQQQLRKPLEAQGREITRQLYLLATGAQLLQFAPPSIAQAWCRMMLDIRGASVVAEQVQSDLLLRATGGAG